MMFLMKKVYIMQVLLHVQETSTSGYDVNGLRIIKHGIFKEEHIM